MLPITKVLAETRNKERHKANAEINENPIKQTKKVDKARPN